MSNDTLTVFIAPYANPTNGEWIEATDAPGAMDRMEARYGEGNVGFMDTETPLVEEYTNPYVVQALGELDLDHLYMLEAWIATGAYKQELTDSDAVFNAVEDAMASFIFTCDYESGAEEAVMESCLGDMVASELKDVPEYVSMYFDWRAWARDTLMEISVSRSAGSGEYYGFNPEFCR